MNRPESTPVRTPCELAADLREKAHHCIRMARSCPDQGTSHALESMSFELLATAAEIDQSLTIPPAESNGFGTRLKITRSTIICPKCHHQAIEQMRSDACQIFYVCKGCGEGLKPLAGDCCVFCSYGSVRCPPMQPTP